MAFLRPEYGIRKMLVDESSVTSLLGNGADGIGPMDGISRVAQFPYIGIQRAGGSTSHHMGGVSASGLWEGSTEVSVFADTPDDASAVADAVRAVLDGGERTAVTVGGDSVTFTMLHLSDEDDEYVHPKDGSDSGIYIQTQEYNWGAEP